MGHKTQRGHLARNRQYSRGDSARRVLSGPLPRGWLVQAHSNRRYTTINIMADLEVVFMDAGQGDCTLIVYPDGSLTLVDCGSTQSGTEAFGEITKVIDRKFQSKQDFALVLTHPDEDHYKLLRQIGVDPYLDGGGPCYIYYGGHISLYQNQRENNYTYKLLNHFNEHHLTFRPPKFDILPDTLLSRAGVNVTILAANCTGDPKSENAAKKNSNSIVLLVEYQGAKIFLMGDAFIQTENFIIDN